MSERLRKRTGTPSLFRSSHGTQPWFNRATGRSTLRRGTVVGGTFRGDVSQSRWPVNKSPVFEGDDETPSTPTSFVSWGSGEEWSRRGWVRYVSTTYFSTLLNSTPSYTHTYESCFPSSRPCVVHVVGTLVPPMFEPPNDGVPLGREGWGRGSKGIV